MELDLSAMAERVRPIPHKLAFFRWITVCVETSNLATEDEERVQGYSTFDFTAESKRQIRAFIDMAVAAFNDTHHLTLSTNSEGVIEAMYEIWARDEKHSRGRK